MTGEVASNANPFPGLRPFRTEEHHLFFGREEQTAALLSLLGGQRFLAVVGTSGSGKSSLVRAGLIPALHRGTMARAGSTWEVVILRPGGNPITSLARALLDADLYDAADLEALPRLRATLTRSRFGLVEAVRQSSALDPAANLLVVVDQFEEVFRFREQGTSAEETAGAFVSLLLAASEASERRIYVAITMRSDYLGDCANIPGLAEAVNRGEYLIPRLSRDQRREAIEKPVGVCGARMAPRLVQQMLNDLGDDPDQLPVLQHALLRTWDAWAGDHRDGAPIDLPHYEATGGMATALSRHADEVFEALPDDEHRRAAEKVFRALTVKGADNRGIRRPTRLDRLARIAGASDAVARAVVEAYRIPGVTFLMPGTGTALGLDTVIDLSHESLMRVWGRLRDWVEEEAQSARVYRRLAETAELWKEGRAGLFRDPDLGIALGWREAARPTEAWAEQHGGTLERAMEFLDRSRDEARAEQLAWEEAMHREVEQATALAEAERRRAEDRQRAARRLKALAAGVAVVAVLALAAMGFAVNARRQAVESAKLAKEKEALATIAAGDAERAASALKRTLVESDFQQGAERIDAGEGSAGLGYLARALRADPGFQPAAARAMTAMASGRFPLRTFPRIAHAKVITMYRRNGQQSLVLTSDNSEHNDSPERYVWDCRTGERLYSVAPDSKGLLHTEWTKNGEHLFGYDPWRHVIRAWEARSGKEEPPIAAESLAGLKSGKDSRGGTLLLGRFEDGALQVWRLPGGEAATPRLTRGVRATGGFAFTPDYRRVAAAYADATIAFWEADGGAPHAEVSTRPSPVQEGGVFLNPEDDRTVLWRTDANRRIGWTRIGAEHRHSLEFDEEVEPWFLPGGSRVAIGPIRLDQPRPRPFRVAVHDLETGERVASIVTPRPVDDFSVPAEVFTLLRFPLAVTREGNAVRVFDLETGALLRDIRAPALLSRAELSPEGRRILTVTTTNDLMLWSLFSGGPLLAEPIEHEGQVDFWFSPDGEKLATHDDGKRVLELYETRTGTRLMEPSDEPVEDLYFTAGGERLLLSNTFTTALGSAFNRRTAGDLRIIDIGTRPILFETLLDPTGSETDLFWTPRGKIVVYGKRRATDPNQVMFWDGPSRRLEKSLPLPQGIEKVFKAFDVSRNGARAFLGTDDDLVRVYDVEKGEVLCEIAPGMPVSMVSSSFDGSRVATGTNTGKVQVWDASTGFPLTDVLDHGEAMITALGFSPDAAVLASGSLDLKLRFADGRSGAELCRPIEVTSIAQDLVFTPDGSHAAALTFSYEVPIIDVSKGTVVRKLQHADACRAGEFTPDGRILAVGTGGLFEMPVGSVYLWEWSEGRQVGRPLNARGPVQELDISPDGALLATGTILENRGAVQVWDMATGQPITDPVPGRHQVSSVAFNKVGSEVVAAWEDGAVRVIDLPPRSEEKSGLLAKLAESVARRKLAPAGGASEEVPPESLDSLRKEIETPRDTGTPPSPHERWARWFLADAGDRPISPGSRVTFREHLARLRRSARFDDLEQALRLAPSDALTHARVGLVLLDDLRARLPLDTDKENDGRLQRHWKATADRYGKRAIELAPGDADVWAHRAEGLRRAGRVPEANAAAARADELGSSVPNAAYARAVALAAEDRWEEADAAFTRAIEAVTGSPAGTAPLLGPLAALEPALAPDGFRDLRLPPPIEGTFEDFDSVPEGGLPSGWSAGHEPTDVPRLEAVSGRMSNANSDVYEDWIIISVDRVVASGAGPPFFAERLLASPRGGRLGGVFPSPLLEGRFLYSLGGDRESSFAHRLSTPDYDCSGRKAVHAAFRSAYEQASDSIAAIEYSIDEGKTWLPVLYRMNAADVMKDAAGKVDGASTFQAPMRDAAPLYLDASGEPRGWSCSHFIGAPISRDLDPHIEGLPLFDWSIAKRVEVFRLPLADGQPRVRLRFLHAGRYGWYWGIDDFGLHEIPGGPVEGEPDTVDGRRDPAILGGLGVASLIGDERPAPLLKPSDFPGLALEERDASNAAAGSARRSTFGLVDGRLLLRRASALAPGNPWLLHASAFASARGGASDEALRTAMRAMEREPPGRLTAVPLAAAFLSRGDALEKAGDAAGAAVAHELAHVLYGSVAGASTPGIIERLARAGLSGKTQVLLPRGSEWRFLDGKADPGPGWTQPDYDASLWQRGRARLGYGGDGEATTLSYGSNPAAKPITAYFRAAFEVADPDLFAYLRLQVLRDDGVLVHVNGVELVRDNMPQGVIEKDTRALDIVGSADEQKYFQFEGEALGLRQGRNVIAVEVHQQDRDSSDLAFDLELEGVGGLKETASPFPELEAVEERLGIPTELRAILWTSRVDRFRRALDLERAAGALEIASRLGAAGPHVAYQRAHLLRARGEESAAEAAYREAVEKTLELKRSPGARLAAFLPKTLAAHVEPLLAPSGVGLAGAARRLVRTGSALREVEARWLLRWSGELDPGSPAARLERAEALLANGWMEEALAASSAQTPGAEGDPRREREMREWLSLRERCLGALGRHEEAREAVEEILRTPPRRPGLSERLIDLSKHYTASIYDGRGWHATENLRTLPETFRPRGGIDFDIRGLVQLQSGRFLPGRHPISGKDMNELHGKSFPEKVEGIPVGLRAKALHFLTSACWTMGAPGMEVSRVVIHYEDGSRADCPIRFREDVIDWSWGNGQKVGMDRIAWIGGRPIKRLMRKTWTNPHPDKVIREIDFVSAMNTAAPFLVAVTAE